MYTIIEKSILNPTVTRMVVEAPLIAAHAEAGQFVIVCAHERGERIPLTIADFDREHGTITIIFQLVGKTTLLLNELNEGDSIPEVAGPLGKASELENIKKVIVVGGGVGCAIAYPQAKALFGAGAQVELVAGFRNRDLVILEPEMRAVSTRLFLLTDDGSYGEHGFVTHRLERLLEEDAYDAVIAIGPLPMMRAVCELTRPQGIRTIVSMNSTMIDGTGMCGCCRLTVGDEVKFACVDGPDFDGHLVNFDEATRRSRVYQAHEEQEREAHRCRLTGQAHEVKKPKVNMAPQKTPMPEQPAALRVQNFDEVALGYTLEMAVNEANRCIDCKNRPCVAGCPVGVDIPAFIQQVAAGDISAAYQILTAANSLPAVCGRVCPQETQCEAVCTRGIKHQPVAIGRLERFVADYMNARECEYAPPAPPNGMSVAVIGAGPAGLTCAADLAKLGYAVTVFEAFHVAGGVLMYGIPEFRLPKTIVQDEIDRLRALGVDIRTNTVAGRTVTMDDLFRMGYKAIFVGSGAGLPNFMNIPGENLIGVYSANEFLTRINLMRSYDDRYDTPLLKMGRVAVIGGGNVTMDAARCARRLDTEQVTVIYRRSDQEMPARAEEVSHAREEEIEFLTLTNITAIHGDEEGRVCSVTCQKMALGEPDDSGRRRPVPVEGSEYELPVDAVIMAIGNSPGRLLKDSGAGFAFDRRGRIVVDDNLGTTQPGVFAGGDAVTGAATVIEAMGAGRKAAAAIDAYCKATETVV